MLSADRHELLTTLMQVDPRTLGANLYLLIGLAIAVVVLLVMLIGVWTLVKYLLWRADKARSDRQRDRERYRPDGRPYPPTAQGLCHRCQKVYPKVYELPTGRRLCPACYEAQEG